MADMNMLYIGFFKINQISNLFIIAMKKLSKDLMTEITGGTCKDAIIQLGRVLMLTGIFSGWVAQVFFMPFDFCQFRSDKPISPQKLR